MLRSVVAACEGVNGLHEKDIQHRLHISCTQAREERGVRREEGQYTKCKKKCIHQYLRSEVPKNVSADRKIEAVM